MTEHEITAVKAAIALDNFWHYMRIIPNFVDAAFVVTDFWALGVKSRRKTPGRPPGRLRNFYGQKPQKTAEGDVS